MALTKKDLQSIKGVVEDVIEKVVEDRIQGSEARMKEFIRSEFRIQNMVLDTRFRKSENHIQDHENKIGRIGERIDVIEKQLPEISRNF